MRLVSWLTCSTALTFRLCEKIIERGNERALDGSLYAESSRRGFGRDMYKAVPTTAVAAAVVRTGRRAKMAAMLMMRREQSIEGGVARVQWSVVCGHWPELVSPVSRMRAVLALGWNDGIRQDGKVVWVCTASYVQECRPT